jgi:hypothetical protein
LNIEEWSGYEVSNEVLEQAALWIAALDSNQVQGSTEMSGANEDIHTRFFDWLQADPSHQQAYFELSELWARAACTKSMSDMIEKSVVLPFPTHPDSPPHDLLLEPTFGEQTASSSWAYTLAIGIIFCGLAVPALQFLF